MDTSADSAPIVVGIDDTPSSRVALLWAIDEAIRYGVPLHIVHAWSPPQGNHNHSRDADLYLTMEHLAAHANTVLAAALRHVHAIAPALDVHGSLTRGRPGAVLLRHATDARMLVVGSRNIGGLVELPLGRVGVHVASHAPCPVVIVRGNPRKTGSVIAGVDGSGHSDGVLEAALDEADLRHATLVAAWIRNTDACEDDIAAVESALVAIHELLDRWCPKYPSVSTKVEIPTNHAAPGLVRASTIGQLLVISRDGVRGEFAGTNLAEVTYSIMHHAHCPVMVLPDKARDEAT